jgi:hypothetical protein
VAHNDIGESRLTGSVGAHQRMDLTGINDKVDTSENLGILGYNVEILEF